MSRVVKPKPRFDNLGELLEKMTGLLSKLGGIPAGRVRLDPFPGTATKRDLVRFHSREDKLYELVDRTLVEKPMGSPESYLAMRLGFQLQTYLAEHDSGFLYGADSLIEMLPDVVRGPDVCFVSWAKRPERTIPTEPISDLIPDLAVEVLSPSNTRGEILRKLKEYFLAGVVLVWVIDPLRRTADVHTAPDVKTSLAESGTLDGSDVLPGFRLPLAKLFERLEKPKGKKPRKTK